MMDWQADRPPWRTLAARMALVLAALATSVRVDAADETEAAPVGARVILRSSDAALKLGDKVVARGDIHRVYRVETAEGPWLWLVAGAVRGWASAADVIAFDRALQYFTTELRKDPRNTWAYQMRGLIWYDLQDYDKAIADEDEAIALAPSDALAYHNRGNAYFAKRDYLKAIADYNEATRLDPRDAGTYETRALAWAAQREYDLAIADLNEALRLDPEGASKYRRRARAWAALHQYEHALADYDRALERAPDDAEALIGRAWIWATCPEDARRAGAKAMAEATRACTLSGWKDPHALGTLAAAAAETGDFAAAVKWQSRAVELFPKDDPQRAAHQSRLAAYQSGKPWREAPAAAR
jgi:tetratricopeptide (TPR) repeat protein